MGDIKKFIEDNAVDEGFLSDWYQTSVTDDYPVWSDEHISEVFGDFYLIPKEVVDKLTNGYWLNRAKHNDHLWAECSECGFRVENYKAVETGISSDDYIGVKYSYCPKCGSKMEVKKK